MRKYHSLTVSNLQKETADSMRMALSVADEDRAAFDFLAGQHLPMQITIDDKRVRRTYSICSAPGQLPLEVGIRVQPGGQFSEYVANELKIGDMLEVMPPFGRFHSDVAARKAKTVLMFAGGSGITPILSIMRATLAEEADSRVILFYGNRRQRTTMFIDDLYALKNLYTERLQLYFLFSQEEQEFEIFSGRLDERKVSQLLNTFCVGLQPDDAFICGPDTMIDTVRNALVEFGIDADAVHAERYGAPRKKAAPAVANATVDDTQATINVILDGHQKSFEMSRESGNIVDAAAEQGIDLPYSCKGGVCATCRTHVKTGSVRMATNYGLEAWEVDKGFVLACQSTPVSDEVTIDYDTT
ncbi:MAG: 2Fe-2S iron-sulfur cluster binding domain-containing protein [Woeseia sp.]|jgi:ring-1,2-phenylacetyl-CoA epoxidase subunit PaaE|nr:2Fe-2S iron-sulfur cluster binding domain-containing protein [Woeseia sp.]